MSRHLYANRYQASAVIGSGRTSEVHRGQDKLVGRDVVIKVLRADLSQDPSFQVRFRREAKNAAALNHPAILAVYDSGERETAAGPVPYIVMEYVDGRTLQDVLADDGTVPAQRALQITAEICAALDFSHRHGMVHRDIKPANVMLGRDGTVKVMDFGIAKAVAGGPVNTTATTVIGSAQYLSPEQARGETGDARSDLYSVGCVLYEMLSGTPPFTGKSPVAVASRHIREAPRPPSEINPRVAKDIDAIVLKALSKNPANRYQTAKEMRVDVARAMAGQAVRATPVMSAAERNALLAEPASGTALSTAVGSGAAGGDPVPHGPVLLAPVVTLTEGSPDEDSNADAAARAKHRWRIFALGAAGVAVVIALWLTLMVILAPPPPAAVAVPDLTGMTLEQAVGKLSDKQLTLGTVTKVDTPDGEAGTVVNQRPSWQTQVDQNTPVNVEIEQP
jgi:serine/threonine-protein kinase